MRPYSVEIFRPDFTMVGSTNVNEVTYKEDCVFTARDVIGEIDVLKDLFSDTDTAIAGLESDIDELREELNLKAEEIQPVGYIKYSAVDPGDDWLKCDGSFISEYDYPELVAVLGKLTPGVDSYTELLQATTSEQISNLCIVDGTVWVYLVKSKKLVGISDTDKKEIPITGADNLFESTTVNVMSKRLTAASTTSDTTTFATFCVPRVTVIRGIAHVVIGYSKPASTYSGSTTKYFDGRVHFVTWKVGEFESTAELNTDNIFRSNHSYANGTTTGTHLLHYLSFSPKNDNDLVILGVYAYLYNTQATYSSNYIGAQVYSTDQAAFGQYSISLMLKIYANTGGEQYMHYFNMLSAGTVLPMEKNTIPVAANGECLVNVSIESRHPVFAYARYNPQTIMDWRTIDDLTLPSRANLFKDSVCYASTQGLWFVFVGTGLLFSESVVDGSWGYLDTQSMIGAITRSGCLDYNIQKNELWISGMDSTGIPRVWKLALPDLYSYASDGAWLPRIESDGVPAYIKARSIE